MSQSLNQKIFLAVDIGGTKIEMAMAHVVNEDSRDPKHSGPAPIQLGTVVRLATNTVADLGTILKEHIHQSPIAGAVIGVAGPVTGRRVKLTNVSFAIDAEELESELKCPVQIINDLEAHGWGLSQLTEEQLEPIQRGEAQTGNKALIAAGTGLGESILFWDGKRHHPSATEGGHATFGPPSLGDIPFLQYMQRRYEHVSWERVVSGIDGFRDILGYLTESKLISIPPDEAAKHKDNHSIGPMLTDAAKFGHIYAIRVVEEFVRFYGVEAGNLALKSMAIGGVYIAGSIVHHVMPWMRDGTFTKGFTEKGRFKKLLSQIPIYIVKDPLSALKGAAYLAHLSCGFSPPRALNSPRS